MKCPETRTIEIYRLISPSGKSYVGQAAKGRFNRFTKHVWDSEHDKSWAVGAAIRKYGATAFKIELVETVIGRDLADAAERAAIIRFRSKKPFGYNLTDGGGGKLGIKLSDETKRRMSEAQKGNPVPMERRAKMSISHKTSPACIEHMKRLGRLKVGVPLSPERRKRLSEAGMGHVVSAETRRKISEGHKARRLARIAA